MKYLKMMIISMVLAILIIGFLEWDINIASWSFEERYFTLAIAIISMFVQIGIDEYKMIEENNTSN